VYDELRRDWEQELNTVELQKLDADFYVRVAAYLRRLREEGRMLDRRTVKANLLRKEMNNARQMLRELVQTRYKKLTRKIAIGEKLPSELMTAEEEKVCTGCSPVIEAYQNFTKNLLRGQTSTMDVVRDRKYVALRFLKEVPEIVGTNLKIYGPFVAEEVASLPVENAKILVKQAFAEKVEVC
jgi:DNA replication initiation complex subunit (GINS family)